MSFTLDRYYHHGEAFFLALGADGPVEPVVGAMTDAIAAAENG